MTDFIPAAARDAQHVAQVVVDRDAWELVPTCSCGWAGDRVDLSLFDRQEAAAQTRPGLVAHLSSFQCWHCQGAGDVAVRRVRSGQPTRKTCPTCRGSATCWPAGYGD